MGGNALRKDWKAGSFIRQVFLEYQDEPGTVLVLKTNMVNKLTKASADILEGRTDNKQHKYVKYHTVRFLWTVANEQSVCCQVKTPYFHKSTLD